MADNRPDDYVQWRAGLPRLPDPVRRTMGSGDHLSPALFAAQVEKVPDHVVGPDNPVRKHPLGWYGLNGSEIR